MAITENKFKVAQPTTPAQSAASTTTSKPKVTVDLTSKDSATASRDSLIGQLGEQTDELSSYLRAGYDTEFANLGLGEYKTSIANFDAQIAEQTALRDAALEKVKTNPGMSAAAITGDVASMTRQANDAISNLVNQRNSVAGQYNAGIEELKTRLGLQTQAREVDIGGTTTTLGLVTEQLATLSAEEMSSLQRALDSEQFNRSLEQDQNQFNASSQQNQQQFDANLAQQAYANQTSRINATRPSGGSGGSGGTSKRTVTLENGETVELTDSQYANFVNDGIDEQQASEKQALQSNLASDISGVLPAYENWKSGGAGRSYQNILSKLTETYGDIFSYQEIVKMMEDGGIFPE